MSSRNADEARPVGGIYVKLQKASFTFAMHVCNWRQALLVGYFWLQSHAECNESPQSCL